MTWPNQVREEIGFCDHRKYDLLKRIQPHDTKAKRHAERGSKIHIYNLYLYRSLRQDYKYVYSENNLEIPREKNI